MQIGMIGLGRMGGNMTIQYGLMAADAETTSLRRPKPYQDEMNLPEIAEPWRGGSVLLRHGFGGHVEKSAAAPQKARP
ncbi:MAG: hypothetical protein ACO2ER_00955 [Castellaniella sp.]